MKRSLFSRISALSIALASMMSPYCSVKGVDVSKTKSSSVVETKECPRKSLKQKPKKRKKGTITSDVLKLTAAVGVGSICFKTCQLINEFIKIAQDPYEAVVPKEIKDTLKVINEIIMNGNLNSLPLEQKQNFEKRFSFILKISKEIEGWANLSDIIRRLVGNEGVTSQERKSIDKVLDIFVEVEGWVKKSNVVQKFLSGQTLTDDERGPIKKVLDIFGEVESWVGISGVLRKILSNENLNEAEQAPIIKFLGILEAVENVANISNRMNQIPSNIMGGAADIVEGAADLAGGFFDKIARFFKLSSSEQ